MTHPIQEQDVRDAVSVLEYLNHDLIVSHGFYNIFCEITKSQSVRTQTETAVRRMYISNLILSLDKFSEFYSKYSWLLPEKSRSHCKKLKKELERRKIRDIRHTFIGHILNKKTGRPLSNDEINTVFNAATENNVMLFLEWIQLAENPKSLDTVVGVIESTLTELRKHYAYLLK